MRGSSLFAVVVLSAAGAISSLAIAAAPAAKPAAAAAGAGVGAGKTCKLAIAATDAMQYDKKELKVAADCAVVELTLKHAGKLPINTMGHNWVLTKTADAARVAADGVAAGLANHYIRKGDVRVIAHTKVVGGGQSDTIRFPTSKLKKGEAYTYECTFPGHSAIMKGKFVFG